MIQAIVKSILLLSFCVFIGVFCTSVWVDGINFVSILSHEYKTPWYDNSFIRQPVTKTVLFFCPSREYVTTNATNTQEWKCREVTFRGKDFWTILEKKEIK